MPKWHYSIKSEFFSLKFNHLPQKPMKYCVFRRHLTMKKWQRQFLCKSCPYIWKIKILYVRQITIYVFHYTSVRWLKNILEKKIKKIKRANKTKRDKENSLLYQEDVEVDPTRNDQDGQLFLTAKNLQQGTFTTFK